MFGLPVLLAALSLVGAPGLPARCNPNLPPSREAQTHYPNASSPADLIEFGQDVCGGDLGAPQVQKFDIETWMPGREAYGETHSASRFHDYQARRLKLRYRDADKKVRFCHTLNNTVIASPRILIPILEQYQNPDGSVTIPKALRPYMNGMEMIRTSPGREPG